MVCCHRKAVVLIAFKVLPSRKPINVLESSENGVSYLSRTHRPPELHCFHTTILLELLSSFAFGDCRRELMEQNNGDVGGSSLTTCSFLLLLLWQNTAVCCWVKCFRWPLLGGRRAWEKFPKQLRLLLTRFCYLLCLCSST